MQCLSATVQKMHSKKLSFYGLVIIETRASPTSYARTPSSTAKSGLKTFPESETWRQKFRVIETRTKIAADGVIENMTANSLTRRHK